MKLILALLIAALVMINAPVNKSGQHAASVNKTTAVPKVSAPLVPETVQPAAQGGGEVLQPEVAKVETPAPQTPLTDKQALMQQAGIPPADWPAAEYIFHKESTWRPAVVNEIGCKGLGQSCPGGSGLERDCPNWPNDSVCQLRHFSKYAAIRYGSWQQALVSWNAQGWW